MADAPAPTDAETPPASDEPVPEVTIEKIGPALKRLTITVPAEAIRDKLDASLGTLAGQAQVPGFRKGRTPRVLLEKRFGKAVRAETRNQIMAQAYARVVEAHKIEPVGEPAPAAPLDQLEIREGEPLTFAVDVEVVPEFELPPLEGLEIRKPLLEITPERIEAELRRHLKRLGTPVRVDSGFQEEDRIQSHVKVTRKDQEKPLYESDQVVVVVPGTEHGGRGPVAGILIDDLGERLRAARTGETIRIETAGPEAHEIEELRGAPITIELRLVAAERIEPSPVQAMIDKFDLGTEENLREQLRLALEHQRDQEQAAAMREQVFDHLLAHAELELPEKLSAAQAARNLEGYRVELLYRGVPVERVETALAEVRAESDAQTRRRLKLFFILRRLAEHFKVEVNEQEVNGRVAEIAAGAGRRPDQIRAELARTGRLGEVARMVREHKAADRVISKARVTEVSAEEWNAMVRGEAEKRRKTATGPRGRGGRKAKASAADAPTGPAAAETEGRP